MTAPSTVILSAAKDLLFPATAEWVERSDTLFDFVEPETMALSKISVGSRMKFHQAHASVLLAIASFVTLFAGASALVVTYAPQVSAEVIARAHDRGYLLILLGVLGFVASSALAGHSFRTSPKLAILALSVILVSLLFPLVIVLFA